MRLPINFILYLLSTGLLGAAGYAFHLTLQKSKPDVHQKMHEAGVAEARDRLGRGHGGPVLTRLQYDMQRWKDSWMAPNLFGKEKPQPKPPGNEPPPPPPAPPVRPLTEIIELVLLMHDSSRGGEGGQTQVVVKYKDGVEVDLPSWYLAERGDMTAPTGGPAGDSVVSQVPPPRGGRGGRPPAGRPAQRPTTPMPGSTAGMERLQLLSVDGDGSRHHETKLWPPFDNIRLKSVSPDGLVAVFLRESPPANPGDAPPPPVEEELYKGAEVIGQDLKRTLVLLGRGDRQIPDTTTPAIQPGSDIVWPKVEETTRIDNVWYIGTKDQESMRQDDGQKFFERVQLSDYVSRSGTGLRGVQIAGVPAEVADRYGVQQGDLILSVNGEQVSTRAQALVVGKRLYNKGVRTFEVRFLTANGREITRTYQAPPDR